MGGAVLLFPKLLPPPPFCRLPTLGRLCPPLLSTLGSAQAVQSGLLLASSSVWGCWHSWAHRPVHPTSALSLPPLPLCADVSVSSEDTGLRFGAVLLQCELILQRPNFRLRSHPRSQGQDRSRSLLGAQLNLLYRRKGVPGTFALPDTVAGEETMWGCGWRDRWTPCVLCRHLSCPCVTLEMDCRSW